MLLKLKKGQDPDKFGTTIASVEIDCRNNLEECVKAAALVSIVKPHYGATIIGKIERLESAEGEKKSCDAILEAVCKLWRVGGFGEGYH